MYCMHSEGMFLKMNCDCDSTGEECLKKICRISLLKIHEIFLFGIPSQMSLQRIEYASDFFHIEVTGIFLHLLGA